MGDLNLWNADDISERFYSSKTRQFHATHLSTGDRLWSCFPFLRPMATITADTLGWSATTSLAAAPRAVRTCSPSPVRYGMDEDGGGVHDVIGSRCDPYTQATLRGTEYNHCCHSNLTRSLVERGVPVQEAQGHVHDVLNVFMCTGFTRDTGEHTDAPAPALLSLRSSC